MQFSIDIFTLLLFMPVNVLGGKSNPSSSSGHLEKIIIFSSFTAFIVGVIVFHCYLKHQKLKREEEMRAFMECNDKAAGLSSRGRETRRNFIESKEKLLECNGTELRSITSPMYCGYGDEDDKKQLVMKDWEIC